MARFEVYLSELGLPTETLCDSFDPGEFEIISILDGPNKKQTRLLLRHLRVAPYFAKAFEGGFKEGKTKILELPDEDPDTFKLFIGWLYRGFTTENLAFKGHPELLTWTRFHLMVDMKS